MMWYDVVCVYRETAASVCKLPVQCLLMTMDDIEVPFEDPTVDISVYTVEATNMFSRKNVLKVDASKGEICTTAISAVKENLDVAIEL